MGAVKTSSFFKRRLRIWTWNPVGVILVCAWAALTRMQTFGPRADSVVMARRPTMMHIPCVVTPDEPALFGVRTPRQRQVSNLPSSRVVSSSDKLDLLGLSRSCGECFRITHIKCWRDQQSGTCGTGCGFRCSGLSPGLKSVFADI